MNLTAKRNARQRRQLQCTRVAWSFFTAPHRGRYLGREAVPVSESDGPAKRTRFLLLHGADILVSFC